jgi:hypothetical protein
MALPGVAGRGLSRDQPALLEASERAAQIAGVEVEHAADVSCGRRAAFENLVEDACFGKRIGAAEIRLAQHAELARVKAVKPAHPGNAIGAHPILGPMLAPIRAPIFGLIRRPIPLPIPGGAPFAALAVAPGVSIRVSSICAFRHRGSFGQILD